MNPDPGYAVKEVFYTVKGDNVYVILPTKPGRKILLRDLEPSSQSVVTLIESDKVLKWKKPREGMEVFISLSDIAILVCQPAYTLKVSRVKN